MSELTEPTTTADLSRLEAEWRVGRLVRPSSDHAGFVDLVRAVAAVAGGPEQSLTPHGERIVEEIGAPTHLVAVLADGLGRHFIDDLPSHAWLRRSLRGDVQAVYPPTTATAVTSMATGEYASTHGATGWWAYLEDFGEVSLLPYQRLSDEKPLEELGASADETFPGPRVARHVTRDSAAVVPATIVDSVYSRDVTGFAVRLPYSGVRDGAERVAQRVREAAGPTYTYWYTSRVDSLAHELGTDDRHTRAAVDELDEQLRWLAEDAELPRGTTIVVTADHGHLNVVQGRQQLIAHDAPILAHLRCNPTGDTRVLYFHLKEPGVPDARLAFEREFRQSYGHSWVLLPTDVIEQLRLFGPELLSAVTRERIGEYTAISLDGSVMRHAGDEASAARFLAMKSHHSGMSAPEMTIPLVVGRASGSS